MTWSVCVYSSVASSQATFSQSRNFALNPKEGLKISAFKNAHTPEAWEDKELEKVARYMIHIANVDDFTTLTHKVGTHLI
jgi:hypothetical protein